MKSVLVKRKRFMTVLVLCVFMALTVTACNDVAKSAYETLFLAGTAYDTSMKIVSSLQKQGKITTDQRTQINAYATKFYGTYQLACALLVEYNKTKDSDTQTKLASAISDFTLQWGTMAGYVNSIIPATLPTSPTTPVVPADSTIPAATSVTK